MTGNPARKILSEETMQYRRGWIALFLFALSLINYIDRVTLSFAASPIAQEYSLSPVMLGYLFSSFLWTYTLCLIPMGIMVDRFGAKRVAGFGLGLWSFATAATGLSFSFASLLATRLLMGAGEASSNPAGARVIREWIPAGERGILNSIFNSGSYAGPALCALVAGPIIAAFGWRALFFVAGAIGLIWLLCWIVWFARPEDATWLGDEERQKIVRERDAKRLNVAGTPEKTGLIKLLGCGTTLWGLALTQGCNVYSQYLFLTWLPSYPQSSKRALRSQRQGFMRQSHTPSLSFFVS
jgi:MFS family permease